MVTGRTAGKTGSCRTPFRQLCLVMIFTVVVGEEMVVTVIVVRQTSVDDKIVCDRLIVVFMRGPVSPTRVA